MLCYVCLERAECERLSDSVQRIDCRTCGSYVVDRVDVFALNDARLGAWRNALRVAKQSSGATRMPVLRAG